MNISDFVEIMQRGPDPERKFAVVSRHHELSGYVTDLQEDEGEFWFRLQGANGQWGSGRKEKSAYEAAWTVEQVVDFLQEFEGDFQIRYAETGVGGHVYEAQWDLDLLDFSPVLYVEDDSTLKVLTYYSTIPTDDPPAVEGYRMKEHHDKYGAPYYIEEKVDE